MTDPIHALLLEMADELDHSRQCLMDDRRLTHPLADRARAALAAAPKGLTPSDGELHDLAAHCVKGDKSVEWVILRALARWGRPATTPVPAAAEGEVVELVEWMREIADQDIGLEPNLTRAATLLRQLAARATLAAVHPTYCWEVRTAEGEPCASGDAPTAEEAEREGRHYLAQYQQDGPHQLRVWAEYSILEVSDG